MDGRGRLLQRRFVLPRRRALRVREIVSREQGNGIARLPVRARSPLRPPIGGTSQAPGQTRRRPATAIRGRPSRHRRAPAAAVGRRGRGIQGRVRGTSRVAKRRLASRRSGRLRLPSVQEMVAGDYGRGGESILRAPPVAEVVGAVR